MNKRQIGNDYEVKAMEYLMGLGYKILERNFTCKTGEIDIVAKDDGQICFIEVKYRKNKKYGYPGEAISQYKRFTIMKVARFYLKSKGYHENLPIRFDVVLIMGEEITLIKNAFGGF